MADINIDTSPETGLSIGQTISTIVFDPLLPYPFLAIAALIYLVMFIILVKRGKRNLWLRGLIIVGFFIVFLNPINVMQTRKSEKNEILVVLDETQSQKIDQRRAQLLTAFEQIQKDINNNPKLRMQSVRIRHNSLIGEKADEAFEETHLFAGLKDALSNMDKSRLGGIIIISDGQVHDLPESKDDKTDINYAKLLGIDENIPVHALITGSDKEIDRQIIVENTPFYGITGQDAAIDIKILVSPTMPRLPVPVTYTVNGKNPLTRMITPDTVARFELPVEQAGHNIYQFSIPDHPSELSTRNNTKVVTINGVRDRLQVLLISGKPNHGGRMWRDILRSDASVDLVHFTILREPGKFDVAPKEELSLIEFPIKELFETKINNFDLIVFDRYGLIYLLPPNYFDNIHDFVKNGGGLLVSIGPESLDNYSIFDTSVGDALPAERTGEVINERYLPALSRLGLRHPVTAPLKRQGENSTKNDIASSFPLDAAPWFRQIELTPKENAQVVMNGARNSPLLILNRYEKGRVALLASDQLWLWARGFDASGPNRPLLKRSLHWLMKEPDLEENGLQVNVQGKQITLTKRSIDEKEQLITMVLPNGKSSEIRMKPKNGEAAEFVQLVEEAGIYKFFDQQNTVFAVVGNLNSPEMVDLLSTKEKLSSMIYAQGGYIERLESKGVPELRVKDNERSSMSSQSGIGFASAWIGLWDRKAYSVTGTKEAPLIPSMPAFLFLFLGLVCSWVFESRKK
jgi:uncharacterized membrane protein